MAKRELLECSFLIPLRRDKNLSDGRPHKRTAWRWLDGELYEFGGATRSKENYSGWQVDPDTGKRVMDESKKFFVAVSGKHLARLRAVLQEACAVFQQKYIYLSVAGHVEFVGACHEPE